MGRAIRDDDPILVVSSGYGGREEGQVVRGSWEETNIEEIGWGNDAEVLTELVAHRLQGHFGFVRLTRLGRTSWRLTEPGELSVTVRAELDYDALVRDD